MRFAIATAASPGMSSVDTGDSHTLSSILFTASSLVSIETAMGPIE
jgi:hypothetical protein